MVHKKSFSEGNILEFRELRSGELTYASKLIWNVFSKFVAPGYTEEGIETFRKYIEPLELLSLIGSGKLFMSGCFDQEKIVGVAAIRDYCHVSLLFVDKEYHGRGIAKALFSEAAGKCIKEKPEIQEITVNSSPFAVPVYKKLGFIETGEQVTNNGITFVPMSIAISSEKTCDLGIVRHIKKDELKGLLELYRQLNEDDPELCENEKLMELWEGILEDKSQNYLVVEAQGKLVSSCVLVIINNLTRGARPYGLIENVITHENYRKKGYGMKLIKKAVEFARDKGCYKVMLMSGRGEETIRFYEKAGFERGKKTGFIIRFD